MEAAQPLVVEHSCLLLQPLPAHPHKAQTQSPAHRQSITLIPSGTPSFTAIYLFSSTKGFPNKKHSDGAILICTVSLVGKLLTPVFPPCPNSIANLFSPQLVFTSSRRTNLFLSGSYFAIMKEKSTTIVPMSEQFCTYSFLPASWFIFGDWLGPYLASWLP